MGAPNFGDWLPQGVYWGEWFAWRPVRLDTGGWAWLRRLERREEVVLEPAGGGEYRKVLSRSYRELPPLAAAIPRKALAIEPDYAGQIWSDRRRGPEFQGHLARKVRVFYPSGVYVPGCYAVCAREGWLERFTTMVLPGGRRYLCNRSGYLCSCGEWARDHIRSRIYTQFGVYLRDGSETGQLVATSTYRGIMMIDDAQVPDHAPDPWNAPGHRPIG